MFRQSNGPVQNKRERWPGLLWRWLILFPVVLFLAFVLAGCLGLYLSGL
jgi:hypothetical protein